MKKIICLTIIFLLFTIQLIFSFESNPDPNDIGKGGAEDHSFLEAKNSNFKKGKDALKQALKLKKKKKEKKADKRLEKALNYFILAYKNSPENFEVLNNLGFTYYLLEDFMMSEIYYNEALLLDPKNPMLNKRLGYLYLKTKKVKLAKERLNVLSLCKCDEFSDLKSSIASFK